MPPARSCKSTTVVYKTNLFVCFFPKILFLSNVHTHCGAQTHDADTRSHVPLTEPAGHLRTSFPVTLAWSLRVPRITLVLVVP